MQIILKNTRKIFCSCNSEDISRCEVKLNKFGLLIQEHLYKLLQFSQGYREQAIDDISYQTSQAFELY